MQFVRELRNSSLLMPLLLTPSIRCQLLSRSRTLLQCKASNLTDSVSEEGLKLNARRLLIQVWSSWYAVNCLSPASQNTHSFCSKLGIIRTFFFSSSVSVFAIFSRCSASRRPPMTIIVVFLCRERFELVSQNKVTQEDILSEHCFLYPFMWLSLPLWTTRALSFTFPSVCAHSIASNPHIQHRKAS